MRFQAVLFDLDGTLIDSIGDIAACMNRLLAEEGVPGHSVEEYKNLVGEGITRLVEKALPPGTPDPRQIPELVQRYHREYERHFTDTSRPYEGVPELLDVLSQKHVPLAILSNKSEELTRIMVERFLWRWRFAQVLGEMEERPRKPHPAAALEIARRMGLAPEVFVYLGDSSVDMHTAQAAGMHPVGALWGFRSSRELAAAGAAALIRKPAELLDFFP